jgi:hypothetical protein
VVLKPGIFAESGKDQSMSFKDVLIFCCGNLGLEYVPEPDLWMNGRRFARHIQHAIGIGNPKIPVPLERIQMALLKSIPWSANVALDGFLSFERGVRQDRHTRMPVKKIFTSLIVIKTGHHQDHAIRKVNVVRTDGWVE